VLGQFIPHHFGGFLHTVFYLFLAEQDHIIDPGNLDQNQSDQGETDQHGDYGKYAFQILSNRFVIYCIRFIFTTLSGKWSGCKCTEPWPVELSPGRQHNQFNVLFSFPSARIKINQGWFEIIFNLKLNYD